MITLRTLLAPGQKGNQAFNFAAHTFCKLPLPSFHCASCYAGAFLRLKQHDVALRFDLGWPREPSFIDS